jgi:molecular chaperone GrpE
VTAAQGGSSGAGESEQHEPVVIRDKRRVNPFGTAGEAGTVPPSPPTGNERANERGNEQGPDGSQESEEVRVLTTQLEERTADLQRLKAEYDNYRRRADRDRQAGADQAAAKVLSGLLATLDDIDRAAEHGDLTGPFQAVATGLLTTLTSVGLERYGQAGDPFDPQVHEALVHTFQPGLEGPTCVEIYRSGYRYAGRVLRPAQVVVAEPPAPEESADGST